MAAQYTLEELEAEQARRSGKPYTGTSVLEPQQETTAVDEFKKFAESALKGAATGISADLFGGWGNLYDYLKKSKDPSAFSTQGIIKGIENLTGVNLLKVPGYTGAFEFSRAGAPAAGLTAVGLPGLFSRTPKGVVGEFGVAGTTGVAAETVAPESPLAQFAIQSSPYAAKGLLGMTQARMTKPVGQLPPETADLLTVGRMTPGEATGSRRQLATEQRVEAAPSIEAKGTTFRQEQATDVESYLNKLFDRASSKAITDPQALTDTLSTSFQNFGKALSSKLRSDASKDFGAASRSTGLIDTQPVISAVQKHINEISPEVPGFSSIQASMAKILDEFAIPEKPATSTPSLIVDESGRPAMVTETPAVPADSLKIPIDRLQKNLSAWGQAAWSGEYDLKGTNIFAGIAPGQAKGIARAVLRGYKDALDSAIDANVPGADKLKKARDNFANNLRKIDEFSDMPIVKEFGKPSNQLVPETDVIPKLRDMPQTQRKLLFNIVGDQAPEVADSIRRLQFNDVLDSAFKAAAAKNEPSFVIDKALQGLNKKDGDLSFLFPNQADLNDATRAIKYMKTVLQSSQGGAEAFAPGVTAYGITRGVGATSATANAISQVASAIRDVLADPNAFANIIFDKDTVKSMLELQKASSVSKAIDVLGNIGKATAVQAVRSGPRLSTEPAIDTEKQAPSDQIPLSELEAEAARRGLTVE